MSIWVGCERGCWKTSLRPQTRCIWISRWPSAHAVLNVMKSWLVAGRRSGNWRPIIISSYAWIGVTPVAPAVASGFSPLDEELELLPGKLTPRLQQSVVRMGSWMPFEKAAGELEYLSLSAKRI